MSYINHKTIYQKHKLIILFIACTFASIITLFISNPVSALSCNSNSSAERQCNNRKNGSASNLGVMWINDVSGLNGDNRAALESETSTVDFNRTDTYLYIHGAINLSSNSQSGDRYGSCVHIYDQWHNFSSTCNTNTSEDTEAFEYTKPIIFRGRAYWNNNATSDSDTKYGTQYWTSDWENKGYRIKLKADKFKEGATVTTDEDGRKIYSRNFYIWRCYSESELWGWDYSNNISATCGNDQVTVSLREATKVVTENYNGDYTSESYAWAGNESHKVKNTDEAKPYYVNSSSNKNTNTKFSFQHYISSNLEKTSRPEREIKRDNSILLNKESITVNGNSKTRAHRNETLNTEEARIDLGTKKKICQTISHTEKASYTVEKTISSDDTIISRTESPITYSGWKNNSSQACAEARHPYDFTTSASIEDLPATYDLGSTIDIKGSVKNASTHDNNKSTPQTITPADTKYRLLYFTVNPNTAFGAVKIEGISGYTKDDPCLHFKDNSKGVTCHSKLSENEGSVDPGKEISLSGKVTIGDEVELGTKYCFATAINYTHSGSGYNGGLNKTWTISNATCTGVAKKPHFQVWGGVYSPSSITASQIKKGNTTYGSWAEHLVVAKGKITSFASGASLGYDGYGFSGNAGSTASSAKLNPLTISNNNPNNLGFSKIDASTGIVDVLKDRFANKTEATKIGIDYRDSVSNIGLTARANGTAVYVGNNITISDNICYSKDANTCKNSSSTTLSSYNDVTISNLNNMPQILIFAKNITIKPDVTRIDAWLISDGTINTCVENSDQCSKTLVINGPVFANELKLNRTAGASGGAVNGVNDVLNRDLATDGYAAPAEIFNLRGDAYLWSYLQAQRTNEAVTSYIRELAPRL